MFSYFGSKSKLIRYYPKPKYNLIIEPFGGTARYALEYWENDVIITELFDKVYRVWKYLQSASKSDILSLPDIGYKEKIPLSLSDEERWLVGYCVARGAATPCTMGHKFNRWDKDKIRIARDLHKIRHWDIRNDDYRTLDNHNATWYIDPPYISSGYKYKFGPKKLDYSELAEWCVSRSGQVIVCENGDARWLPFKPLKKFRGAFKDGQWSKTECIWMNDTEGLFNYITKDNNE